MIPKVCHECTVLIAKPRPAECQSKPKLRHGEGKKAPKHMNDAKPEQNGNQNPKPKLKSPVHRPKHVLKKAGPEHRGLKLHDETSKEESSHKPALNEGKRPKNVHKQERESIPEALAHRVHKQRPQATSKQLHKDFVKPETSTSAEPPKDKHKQGGGGATIYKPHGERVEYFGRKPSATKSVHEIGSESKSKPKPKPKSPVRHPKPSVPKAATKAGKPPGETKHDHEHISEEAPTHKAASKEGKGSEKHTKPDRVPPHKKQLEPKQTFAPKSDNHPKPFPNAAVGGAPKIPKKNAMPLACQAEALKASKCKKEDLQCTCRSKAYHSILVTCATASNATYQASLSKYVGDCNKAGHPIAAFSKAKGDSNVDKFHASEAGKANNSSNATHAPKVSSPAAPSGTLKTAQDDGNQDLIGSLPVCARSCPTVAAQQMSNLSQCITVACQCKNAGYQNRFEKCVSKVCNDADQKKVTAVGQKACAAAVGGGQDAPPDANNGSSTGTASPSTSVQPKASSAFGLCSSVTTVFAGAIGVAFATLL
ncbi:BQ2448_3714 [Microbotryum intermedium]|uniref:BQ2448_3714 protein n=1 Tax=Microbotryum intermedium TaxID=269621 RepID=A0A238FAS7_9BASI|nr:BQ2448_3714 [Microbotryum intermedium]